MLRAWISGSWVRGAAFAVVAGLFAVAHAAADTGSGECVQITTQDGNTVVTLRGRSGSAAAAIFAALENTDIADRKLVQASVSYLNGVQYDANLTIGPGSSYGLLPNHCAPANACPKPMIRLVIGGDVANELFEDLQKTDNPEPHGLSCSDLVAGEARYSCSISISTASPGALKSW